MTVFDTARNMTPPATKVGSSQAVKAGYSRKTELWVEALDKARQVKGARGVAGFVTVRYEKGI